MNRLLTILGGIFAVILVIIGIAAVILIPRALKLNRDAIAYIQDAVPKIVDHWNSQELVDRATPALISAVKSREELDRLFVMMRRLGALKHLDTPKGTVTSGAYAGTGTVTTETVTIGNYTVEAEFEKGPATIQIQLQRVSDVWKINGFHVNSDIFLSPPTNESPRPTPGGALNPASMDRSGIASTCQVPIAGRSALGRSEAHSNRSQRHLAENLDGR